MIDSGRGKLWLQCVPSGDPTRFQCVSSSQDIESSGKINESQNQKRTNNSGK